MTSGSEADTDEETSRSWPDTEFGLLEQPPESPPLATRRTFSHYTQVGIYCFLAVVVAPVFIRG